MSKTRKAILVVSFGTSFPDTCKKTIDVIEQRIGEHFSDYKIYRAWTSKMIMAKTSGTGQYPDQQRNRSMEQMITDGIAEVIVQPTHVINGIENDLMKEDALAFKNRFERITFGDPLLTTQQDHVEIVNAICQEFSNLPADCALILMGHGTSHYANDVYAALDYRFKDLGFFQYSSGYRRRLSDTGKCNPYGKRTGSKKSDPRTFHDRSGRSCTKRYVRR